MNPDEKVIRDWKDLVVGDIIVPIGDGWEKDVVGRMCDVIALENRNYAGGMAIYIECENASSWGLHFEPFVREEPIEAKEEVVVSKPDDNSGMELDDYIVMLIGAIKESDSARLNETLNDHLTAVLKLKKDQLTKQLTGVL